MNEQVHAQQRADEAKRLAEVAEDHEVLRDSLQRVSDDASSIAFELSASLLTRVLER